MVIFIAKQLTMHIGFLQHIKSNKNGKMHPFQVLLKICVSFACSICLVSWYVKLHCKLGGEQLGDRTVAEGWTALPVVHT
jgi:hypothetical protein